MNKAQKAAWFTWIILATALGLSLAAFRAGYFVLGVPASRAAGGFGPMGLTVNYLPWVALGGFCVVMLVQALGTLQQCGWTSQEANHE